MTVGTLMARNSSEAADFQNSGAKPIRRRKNERLFAQIKFLSKPTNDFRELRLAGIIELSPFADQNGIPGKTRWSDYRYPGAIALRLLAQLGHDHAF
jgi:hypothetical protein